MKITLLFIQKTTFTLGYIFEQKPLSRARHKLKQSTKQQTLGQTQTSTSKQKKSKKIIQKKKKKKKQNKKQKTKKCSAIINACTVFDSSVVQSN